MLQRLDLYSTHTDPVQHLIAAAIGSTVDDLDYLDYLDDLVILIVLFSRCESFITAATKSAYTCSM